MFCNNCGKQIKDGAKFCPFCGSLVPEDDLTVDLPDDGEKKKKRKANNEGRKKPGKGKIIFLSVLALVIVAVLGSVIFVFTSPAHQLTSRLKKQDYDRVVSIYDSKVKGNSIQTLLANHLLLSGISGTMDDFGANKIEFETAKSYLQTVSGLDGMDAADEAAFQLEKLESLSESKSAYEAAEAYYESGDYASAISEYQNVSQEDTENYENAQNQIKTATDSYRSQILEKTDSASTSDEFKDALDLIGAALLVLPDDEELSAKRTEVSSKYAEVVKTNALDEGTKALADKEYEKAFSLIQEALELNPNDSDLLSLLNNSESAYEEYIIDEVDSYVEDNNYNKAISELNTALKVLPDNSTLKDKLGSVQDSVPVSLSTIPAINGGFSWDEGNPEDPFGNTYNDATNFAIFDGGSDGNYAEFRVYGEYSTFSFSVAPHADIPEDASAQVQVFVDDQLVKTTDTVYRKSDKKTYDVKINNAQYIKIVVNTYDSYYYDTDIILMDCTLKK